MVINFYQHADGTAFPVKYCSPSRSLGESARSTAAGRNSQPSALLTCSLPPPLSTPQSQDSLLHLSLAKIFCYGSYTRGTEKDTVNIALRVFFMGFWPERRIELN